MQGLKMINTQFRKLNFSDLKDIHEVGALTHFRWVP